MAVKGKVIGEKVNFFYNSKKFDFIYLFADSFRCGEDGNLYLERDVVYHNSFKDLVTQYQDYLPAIIPVSVVGDDETEDSYIFHFNASTKPFCIEVISKFEAKECLDSEGEILVITDAEVEFTNDEIFTHSVSCKKRNDKYSQKLLYERLLRQELQSLENKYTGSGEYEKAKVIMKKIEKRSKKIKKIKSMIN